MTESKPTLRDQLGAFVGPAAKAVAAFVTPLVAALVTPLVAGTGVPMPFEPSAFEAFVTAVVTAFLVWAIANRPNNPITSKD